jgi:DNA-binding response OmpR family regulator
MADAIPILIIDDDPLHLGIYCKIVETAGFRGLPILVSRHGIDLPSVRVGAVLLDYCLTADITAREVAMQVRAQFPFIPILILSDLDAIPSDIAPLVQAFVRKGNPAKLLSTLRAIVQVAEKVEFAGSGQPFPAN